MVQINGIEIRGLTKRFGKTTAVSDINLDIPAGTVFGLLGPNGSGKSTIMRLINGLLTPTKGSVEIFGVDLQARRALALSGVSSMTEISDAYRHLSARNNLAIAASFLGTDMREVDRVLDFVGLAAHAKRKVGNFSLGMRQRLSLARALLGRPRLLLLDEPMNGLDPDSMIELRKLLLEMPSNGTTILISTHLLDEAERVCSHVAFLKDGHLRCFGKSSELLGRFCCAHVHVDDVFGACRVMPGATPITSQGEGGGFIEMTMEKSDSVLEEMARITREIAAHGILVSETRRADATMANAYQYITSKD